MPFYEYKCLNCDNYIIELQGINDEPLSKCPDCDGELKRMISASTTRIEYGNKKEYYEKVIKKDVKEIVDKVRKGDDNTISDVFGEK